jgi:serine/threonine-protein kinase
LEPDDATIQIALGAALGEKQAFADARAALEKALHLDPKCADAYKMLGNILAGQGEADAAIAYYRKGIACDPNYADLHYNLANVLRANGDLEGSVKAYQEALRCKPDYAEAHCNLAQTLRRLGRMDEALTEIRRGHELGSKSPTWTYPSARWVKDIERAAEAEARLTKVLRGEESPRNAAERLELAELCVQRRRFVAAARFAQDAFADKAVLEQHVLEGARFNVAFAAAQAGCGQGDDAKDLDDKERARWRRQALEWLRDDLALWGKIIKSDAPPGRAAAQQVLRSWLGDPQFGGVRDGAGLARLPRDERDAWRKLWADVDDVLNGAAPDDGKPEKPDHND